MNVAITNPIHVEFFGQSRAAVAPLTRGQKQEVLNRKRFWLKGADDGWKWVQGAYDEDVEAASRRYTFNEILIIERDRDDFAYLSSLHPGFNPETDLFFERVYKKVEEFRFIDDDGVAVMNAPFRAYWDGWAGAVREFHLLADLKPEIRAQVLGHARYWLQGGKDGWKWAAAAQWEQIEEVVRNSTLNEVLVTEPGRDPEFYHSFYPGLNRATSFFDKLAEVTVEFEFVGPQSGMLPMNAPFRSYHDGWLAGVREFYLLAHLEKSENTPDHRGCRMWPRKTNRN